MKLYYATTFHSRKVCALARHLGSPVEFVPVDLARGEQRQPAFLALNPNGKAPLLVDGELKLWESAAIMMHLAIKAGSDLWPSDPAAQVEVMRWLSWDSAHFSRHGGTLYFEHLIRPRFGLGPTDEAAVADADKYFRQFAAILDAHLAERAYLVGDRLSIADFAVATALPWASEARLPLHGFDHVARWYDRLLALPAWREGFPAEASVAA